MKRYIKEHKILVVTVIFLVILIVISFIVKGVFFSNGGNAVYGDRLKGIKEVEITKGERQDLIDFIEEDSSVAKCEYSLQGKIINIIITINDDVGLDTAKSLAGKVLEKLDTDQKKFYDIQVFVKKDHGGNDFPIIGYKQNSKEGFSWTKDRAAS